MRAAAGRPHIERRTVTKDAIAEDIVLHIYDAQPTARAIVITDTPKETLATIKQYWTTLFQKIEHDRSSTLSAARIRALSQKSLFMQRFQMTTDANTVHRAADMYFLNPRQCKEANHLFPVSIMYWIATGADTNMLPHVKVDTIVLYNESLNKERA